MRSVRLHGERKFQLRPKINTAVTTLRTGRWRRISYCLEGRCGGSSSWSPDGRRIAFGGLFVSRADGSHVVRLAGGDHPAWSPDGHWIAFARELDIYVIHPDGSGLHRVTHAPDQSWNFEPDW